MPRLLLVSAVTDPRLTGETLATAIAAADLPALAGLLRPDARMRAIVPEGPLACEGREAIVSQFARWFADAAQRDVLERRTGGSHDWTYVGYRLRVVGQGGGRRVVEQHAILRVEDGRVAAIDLVCSGFVAEPEGPSGDAVVLDAGDLGCGSGLPQEFRRQVSAIPLGARLVVVTGDPSAREDLPSLARLLGHAVESVETRADGRVEIRVVRGA